MSMMTTQGRGVKVTTSNTNIEKSSHIHLFWSRFIIKVKVYNTLLCTHSHSDQELLTNQHYFFLYKYNVYNINKSQHRFTLHQFNILFRESDYVWQEYYQHRCCRIPECLRTGFSKSIVVENLN